jgi:hypothetical protein
MKREVSRILGLLMMSRRCSHGNRKSMGFGRKWRRESPTIKCIIVFMGPFSLVRCGKYRTLISISDLSLHQIFCLILGQLLISRRCNHGNRKSMGFGRKGRRESPTIKCIIVFMGPFSLVRCGKYRTLISISDLSLHQIFCLILVRLLISRRCSHGNRKSMGFGCEWRRESPTIKCNRKSVYRL